MPAPIRPKSSTSNSSRAPPVAPMSERQQMALLMQMTSGEPGSGGRSPGGSSRPRDRNERGETPLHLAAIKGDVELVSRLLARQADPNVADFAGWTPLHEACNHGRYEVAFRLLQSGADPNAKGLDDDTPLHDAAANGHQRLARLLIERGADVRARNAKGKCPLDVATTPSMRQFLVDVAEEFDSSTSSRPQGAGGGSSSRPSREDKKSSDSKKGGATSSQAEPAESEKPTSNVGSTSSAPADDVYEFKSRDGNSGGGSPAEESGRGDGNAPEETDPLAIGPAQGEEQGAKRPFSDIDPLEETTNEDETKRKKRKDENTKESNKSKTAGQNKSQGKQTGSSQSKSTSSTSSKSSGSTSNTASSDNKKSPCASPKPATASSNQSQSTSNVDSDNNVNDETSGGKTDLKVPPLKIVIPQGAAAEQDTGTSRNGKSGSQRSHTALPYVVPSGSDGGTPTEKEGGAGSPESGNNGKDGGSETKKEGTQAANEDQRGGRVLRSHRGTGGTSTTADRGGSSSPTEGSRSPTPPATNSPEAPTPSTGPNSSNNTTSTSDQKESNADNSSPSTSVPVPPATAPATPVAPAPQPVELHPRKRKMKQGRQQEQAGPQAGGAGAQQASGSGGGGAVNDGGEGSAGETVHPHDQPITNCYKLFLSIRKQPVELHPRKRKMKQGRQQEQVGPQAGGAGAQQASGSGGGGAVNDGGEGSAGEAVHPHDQPITNCYKLFLSIRKQIEKRRKGLFPVQPKPPQGFKDYLMNRCTYVLASTAPSTPTITYPANLPQQMKDLFTEQEKERYRLKMQHVIEKEKLVLSVEQEILRVHGRAARALANQSLPFSVCTILRDEEVYNLITPEQEEKDRNARSRYNGRLFLSWLQDVDDKWEKIKEHMLLRHHNEAESLHAVQKMNWEWKMKEHSLCDRKTTPKIDEVHVPMVHVSDDFNL